MTLDLHQLLLLGLLSTSVHWLVARSRVAQPLWSRARGLAGELLRCPACSGWWLGLALGALGCRPVGAQHRWAEVVLAGLLAVVVTPVVETVFLLGLQHSAIAEEHEPVSGPVSYAEPATEREVRTMEAERIARAHLGLTDQD